MPDPATYREVSFTDFPNTGRGKWNLSLQEAIDLANWLLNYHDKVWRGATAPATPHSYELWIYTPPGYNGTTVKAEIREWDGAAWVATNPGVAGRGFNPRGAWVPGTTYAVDDI